MIADPARRVATLIAGVPATTVVLDQASGSQEGGAGLVESIDEGDPDDRSIVTRSDGPGYLVIAGPRPGPAGESPSMESTRRCSTPTTRSWPSPCRPASTRSRSTTPSQVEPQRCS